MSVVWFIIVIQGKESPMFENVINEQAVNELTPDQLDELLAIFEKAGY